MFVSEKENLYENDHFIGHGLQLLMVEQALIRDKTSNIYNKYSSVLY